MKEDESVDNRFDVDDLLLWGQDSCAEGDPDYAEEQCYVDDVAGNEPSRLSI